MSVHESIVRFINDAQEILAREGVTQQGLSQVGERMATLAHEPGLIAESWSTPINDSRPMAQVLYSLGPNALTLYLARFPATAPTPIHDHLSWGVACVVEGRDRYVHWERVDDGNDPGHVQLQVRFERELRAGDHVEWLEPPHDIHSQQGIDGPAWELALFSKSALQFPRHSFDVQTGTMREMLPS